MITPRTPAHFFFPDGIGAGSLFTRHGGFLICLLKVEEGCCSKMKTKSFQHYILTVTHFPLDSGMLKRPYFQFRTTTFFNFKQTYEKSPMSGEKSPGANSVREEKMRGSSRWV